MLLHEIYDPPKIVNKLADTTHDFLSHERKNLNVFVPTLMKKFPDCVYEGPMYRVVSLGKEEMENIDANSDLIKHVRNYKQPSGTIFVSWSKSTKGLGNFMADEENGLDDYEGTSNQDAYVQVYMTQQGVGLDLHKLSKKKFNIDPRNQGLLNRAGEVGEVLAATDQSVRPISYILCGYVYLKNQHTNKSAWHHPKRWEFRTDQFIQMKTAFEDIVNEEPTKFNTNWYSKTKPIDKRSKVREIDRHKIKAIEKAYK